MTGVLHNGTTFGGSNRGEACYLATNNMDRRTEQRRTEAEAVSRATAKRPLELFPPHRSGAMGGIIQLGRIEGVRRSG